MTDPVPGLLNPYDISPEEKKSIQMQNLWGALLQGGMGLMAAGSRVSDGQRAQLLMQAAQPLANMGAMNQAMMQSASREKLNAAAAQRLAEQDQAKQRLAQVVGSPEFAKNIEGMNPAMRMLLNADPSQALNVVAGMQKQKPTEGEMKRQATLRAAGGDQALADRLESGMQKMVVGPDGQPYVVNVATGEVLSGKVGNKPPPPAFQKLGTEAESMYSALDNFKTVISDASNSGRLQAYLGNPRSPEAQKIDGAYQALKASLRSEAFLNTGVLQPGENKMIDDMLLHPRSASGLLASPEAYAAKLGEFQKFIDGRMAGAYKSYNVEPPQKRQAAGGITREQYDALPSGSEFVAPDGSRRRKP